MNLAFSRAARRERIEATEFYEAVGERLAARFVSELQTAIDFIIAFPEGGSPIDRGFRHKPLADFPYSVIYRLDEELIRVVAIAHHKRDRGRLLRRR